MGMVPQGPSNSLLDEEVGMLAVLQDVTGPSQSRVRSNHVKRLHFKKKIRRDLPGFAKNSNNNTKPNSTNSKGNPTNNAVLKALFAQSQYQSSKVSFAL